MIATGDVCKNVINRAFSRPGARFCYKFRFNCEISNELFPKWGWFFDKKNPNRVGDFLSHPLCLFLIVPIKDVIS